VETKCGGKVKNQRVKRMGKIHMENFWKKMCKKLALAKTWINDLEEVKSVEKCQCGKKSENFPWKNITYIVVQSWTTLTPCFRLQCSSAAFNN